MEEFLKREGGRMPRVIIESPENINICRKRKNRRLRF